MAPKAAMEASRKLPDEVTGRLRMLAHDLSNSLETILQAAYLLGQAKLDANSKKWTQLIDAAAQDAARITGDPGDTEVAELVGSLRSSVANSRTSDLGLIPQIQP